MVAHPANMNHGTIMWVLRVFAACFLIIQGSLKASDIEYYELEGGQSPGQGYVLIPMADLEEPEPMDCQTAGLIVPPPIGIFPKDIWRYRILPLVDFKDRLNTRATGRDTRENTDSDVNFRALMTSKIRNAANKLLTERGDASPVDFLHNLRCLVKAEERFPAAANQKPISSEATYKTACEELWHLRFLANMDRKVTKQVCDQAGVNTNFNLIKDMASLQTAFHYRHPAVKISIMSLIPVAAVLAVVCPSVSPSVWPMLRTTVMPAVDLLACSIYKGDRDDLYYPQYFLNRPVWDRYLNANNFIPVHRNLTALESYYTGYAYRGSYYALAVGVLYGTLCTWSYGKTLWSSIKIRGQPAQHKQAIDYYNKALGAPTVHVWRTRICMLSKIILLGGIIYANIANYQSYRSFFGQFYSWFDADFTEQARLIVNEYTGSCATILSATLAELFHSKAPSPIYAENCMFFFSREFFLEHTPQFLAHGYILPNISWQYPNGPNGTLVNPGLFFLHSMDNIVHCGFRQTCCAVYSGLRNLNLILDNTTVNALYKVFYKPEILNATLTPDFIMSGLGIVVILPQLIMTFHLMWWFFVSVW
jgi:hypothetical protein